MRNRKDKFFAQVSLIVGLLVVVATGIPLRAQTDLRYGVAESKDVMVAMRDGVKLAADIYRPTQYGQLADGKFPVILMRTPYNKENSAQGANSFVSHGYVVVLQDVRGRYKSEGHWRPHYDDPNDGFDTAQWIGSQPWCDGGIGTMGSSYGGATQHALAIGNAPYIKAMFPATQCRTTDATAFAIMVPSSYASSNGSSLSAMPPELQTRSRRPNAPQAIPPPRKPW